MPELREQWRRLPVLTRGSVLAVLGAAAVFTVESGISSDDTAPLRPTAVTWRVGVTCLSTEATVDTRRSGNTYEFSCINPDGTTSTVTRLQNLKTNIPAAWLLPWGYDHMVDLSLNGDEIDFRFAGQDGEARIWDDVQQGGNQRLNDARVGIARYISSDPQA